MNFKRKILLASLILFCASSADAQPETYLQPFSDRLIINPSFAGFNKNTNFHSGNQYYSVSNEKAYNLFYASFDTYSDKLKGGYGFSFQHGLIAEQNTNLTKLGMSFAGFEIKTANGRIVPSFSTKVALAGKQWFTYSLDMLFARNHSESSPPGKKFIRYFMLEPGTGFIWDTKNATWGLSANLPLVYSLATDNDENIKNPGQLPLSLTFYWAKKLSGNRNGLESSPFKAFPEIILFYNEAFILSRVSFNIEQIDKIYGFFLQNDFTNNIHCVGGTIGYHLNQYYLKLNAGVGIPGISDNMGATCELSLNISIPPVHYSKIKPWAPKNKLD
ncbi:type IX secretion system membrane protein PorP/SprF [uncultured Draconibacterium sp.]|uniref:type IX secretion system membrane protein PorP/SprF n=1 Tax=uncultured Draconibacterium sp. TaxID=1573823 RepID=UPI003217BE35